MGGVSESTKMKIMWIGLNWVNSKRENSKDKEFEWIESKSSKVLLKKGNLLKDWLMIKLHDALEHLSRKKSMER